MEPDEYWERLFLELLGERFEVVVARDNATAERLLSAEIPDIVVGELALADGPSYGLLEQLRRVKNSAALPVVIFSRINTLPDIEAALNLGVSGYFVKGQDTVNDVHKLLLTFNTI